jgi:hypothetical protein
MKGDHMDCEEYQIRYDILGTNAADSETCATWKSDECFQEWLNSGPIKINGHIVERVGCRQAKIIEPDGYTYEGIIFGTGCEDTLEAMLAWHCKGGKPVDLPAITDRELINALTQRVADLEALLGVSVLQASDIVEEEAMPIGEMEVPEEIEIPAFLATDPPETIPAELLDLVREDEAYGDTQTRLWELYLELNGKLMLGLATEEDAKLHTRLHGHLAWISKGAAEVVT